MSSKNETVLVIPDSQNGWRGSRTLHDPRAWKIALDTAESVSPSKIVLLGDMVDFSTLNKKYRKPGDLYGHIRRTVDDMVGKLESLAACTNEVVYIMGNHEERLRNLLIDTNPDLEDVTSVRDLLQFDRLGIKEIGPYGRDYVYRGVIYTHGHKHAKRGGQTAAKYLADETLNVVFGHNHKREIASETYRGKERWAMCPGTLARIDGTVPGTSLAPNWQQGLGLVHYEQGLAWPELIPIINGKRR